jgi:hypothetical protein
MLCDVPPQGACIGVAAAATAPAIHSRDRLAKEPQSCGSPMFQVEGQGLYQSSEILTLGIPKSTAS